MNGGTGKEREERAVDALLISALRQMDSDGTTSTRSKPARTHGRGEGGDESPGERLHPAPAGRRATAPAPRENQKSDCPDESEELALAGSGADNSLNRAEEVDDETTQELEQREREILERKARSEKKGETVTPLDIEDEAEEDAGRPGHVAAAGGPDGHRQGGRNRAGSWPVRRKVQRADQVREGGEDFHPLLPRSRARAHRGAGEVFDRPRAGSLLLAAPPGATCSAAIRHDRSPTSGRAIHARWRRTSFPLRSSCPATLFAGALKIRNMTDLHPGEPVAARGEHVPDVADQHGAPLRRA